MGVLIRRAIVRRREALAFISIMVAAAIGFFSPTAASARSAGGDPHGVYALPAQPLKDAGAFSALSGRPTILILFQPDCPWCLAQFREADDFAAGNGAVQVAAVSLRGTRRALLQELRRARADVPAYRGSPALIAALGAPEGTPRVYAVNAKGRVVAARRGMQDIAALSALVGGD